ncbi:MAG: hypothetical protein ORN85_02605 [Sediminibacterium sp.]|nr:hypothetical protein [Sediminibacterium sp.]
MISKELPTKSFISISLLKPCSTVPTPPLLNKDLQPASIITVKAVFQSSQRSKAR